MIVHYCCLCVDLSLSPAEYRLLSTLRSIRGMDELRHRVSEDDAVLVTLYLTRDNFDDMVTQAGLDGDEFTDAVNRACRLYLIANAATPGMTVSWSVPGLGIRKTLKRWGHRLKILSDTLG